MPLTIAQIATCNRRHLKEVLKMAAICLAAAVCLVRPPECLASAPVSRTMAPFSGFLYFADETGLFLTAVEHRFPECRDIYDRIGHIMDCLIQGPPSGAYPTLPKETRVNAVYVTGNGTAYIDLDDTVQQELPGGAESELLAVYSIVNSLALNLPEIETVKVLIQGMDTPTLAGHIDLTTFFKANMLIIQ